jgi:hypothetical protein
MNTLHFVREGKLWYADLPEYLSLGGCKEDCLMVSGAPELIELFAHGKSSVTVQVSPFWMPGFQAVLSRRIYHSTMDSNGWGWYFATVYDYEVAHDGDDARAIGAVSLKVGLCPVNAWVFDGQHPDTIYVKAV